jgi:FlaA1/EpsC-like NDP-sugar epimerase
MTRFNITLREGVEFVNLALDESYGGELYVPKLKSYRIMDLVKAIAPNCQYDFCGIRPGEKIHEEMITCTDSRATIDCGKYFLVLNSQKILDKYQKLNSSYVKVIENFNYSSGNNEDFLTVEEIRDLIRKNIDPNLQPI